MDNNKIVCNEHYSALFKQLISLLNLSSNEIRNNYADFPICIIDYFEKGEEEKSIEIRFDEEEVTITCLFNEEEKCHFIYLFSDHNEVIEKFISYFKKTLDYNHIKNRWMTSNYFIKVKEINRLSNDICLAFYC